MSLRLTTRQLIKLPNPLTLTSTRKLYYSIMTSTAATQNPTAERKHDVITAYPNYAPAPQELERPGLDKDMTPKAEHLLIEKWGKDGKPYLQEYTGKGLLVGRSALVSGGDSGIGRSVALFYAREGANVTISYLPEEQADAEEVKKLIAEAPHGTKEVLLCPGDLRDDAYVKKLVDEHVKKWGGLDIVVSNASRQFLHENIEDIDMDNVRDEFSTNIIAMICLAKYAVPHMKRGGKFLTSGSVTARKGSKGFISYSATKGAIATFTASLALQLAPRGISVISVAEGPVYTPLNASSRTAEDMDEFGVGGPPLRNRAAQPAEAAGCYVFAASDLANYMTGTTLHINGGQLLTT